MFNYKIKEIYYSYIFFYGNHHRLLLDMMNLKYTFNVKCYTRILFVRKVEQNDKHIQFICAIILVHRIYFTYYLHK